MKTNANNNRVNSRNANAVRSAAFEALESRQMMSVSMNAATDTLSVNGSNAANDNIVLNYGPMPGGAYGCLVVKESGVQTFVGIVATHTTIKVNGYDGDDTIDCSAVSRPVTIDGGWGNDMLKGGSNNDTMIGGIGADFLLGNGGSDSMYGGDADDTLDGGAGNDTLYGGGANDKLQGNVGNDVLSGDAGDDTLDPGAGSDYVWGGAGWDLADYSARTGSVNVSLDDQPNDGGAFETGNVHSDIERLMGGHAGDILTGSWGDNYIYGNGGNDIVHGGGGNDVLFGGLSSFGQAGNTGFDLLFGDAGNDHLWAPWYGTSAMYGGAGNDVFFGAVGDDRLWGEAGNDKIYGGGGADKLYGGDGNDELHGGDGNDILIGVGGNDDELWGDGGTDDFWYDNFGNETAHDITPAEQNVGAEHKVDYFHSSVFTVPIAGTVLIQDIPTDLHGQNFADPINPYFSENYSNHPLFGPSGPTKDDIIQGQLGDCGFASALAAIAKHDAARIRHSIAELGDGTYVVDYHWLTPSNGHDRQFVRVDGDLPVESPGKLAYLHLGKGGSVWAPIMEKAWAFVRKDAGTYYSIEGTWPSEPMRALGGTMTFHDVSVKNWNSATALLKAILNELQSNHAVCYSTPKTNYLGPVVSNHAYMVEAVNCDANGNPTGLVLRNPWGKDGAGSDANPDDGYVTLTPAQAWGQKAVLSAASV